MSDGAVAMHGTFAPDDEVRQRVARIDALLEKLERVSDPAARDLASATVQALVELYGEGLSRIVGHIADTCDDEQSAQFADVLAGDELVSHLLLLHGLHPDGDVDVEDPSEQPQVLVQLERGSRREGAVLAVPVSV